MALVDWTASDIRDLVRRDRQRAAQQAIPFLAVAAVFAYWLRVSEPRAAAVLLGMFLAWVLSVALQMYWVPSRWRVLFVSEGEPMRVTFDDRGITWEAPHGSRHLHWDRISVTRFRDTWIFSVGGHEAAFLPARCLDASETSVLESRDASRAGRAVEQRDAADEARDG